MDTESDILILYPSQEPDGPVSQWVTMLADSLSASLSQLGMDNYKINLVAVNSVIAAKSVQSAKSILFLLTKAEFLGTVQPDTFSNLSMHFSENQFISLVFPTALPYSQIPTELRFNPVYTFFDVDPETGLDRNYDVTGDTESSRLYWAKVLDLAYDLGNFLSGGKLAESSEKLIYLAQTTPDQYENRDAIRSELIQRGFKICPEYQLSGSYPNISENILAHISKCVLSIHIVGTHYGENIPNVESSLVELQCRQASKHLRISSDKQNQQHFQRLVWIQPGIRPSDERQRRFLNSLRVEEKSIFSEVLQTPLEELKAVLREKLAALNTTILSSKTESPEHSVYLIYEPKDLPFIEDISDVLKEQKLKIFSLDFSKKSDTVVATHYAFLTHASSVIICDFDCNQYWINSKLKDIIKAPGFGRQKSFSVTAVLSKQISRFSNSWETGETLLLDANQKLSVALEPFVQKLNQN
jgi:hypothetical protein